MVGSSTGARRSLMLDGSHMKRERREREGMMNVTAYRQDEEPSRIERLELLRQILDAGRILALHDHKGCLSVNWSECPNTSELGFVIQAWQTLREWQSNHYVRGVPLVLDNGGRNPFDGSAA
jgi:hypothetical protein